MSIHTSTATARHRAAAPWIPYVYYWEKESKEVVGGSWALAKNFTGLSVSSQHYLQQYLTAVYSHYYYQVHLYMGNTHTFFVNIF